MYNEKTLKRFWAKVNKDTISGCWLWTAGGSGKYGVITFYDSKHEGGRKEKVHRVSWHIHNGEIPEGMIVRHICANDRCVKPNHLFLSTHKDRSINSPPILVEDYREYGRRGAAKRWSNPPIKSNDFQAIREAHELGESIASIARRYGCNSRTIKRIL